MTADYFFEAIKSSCSNIRLAYNSSQFVSHNLFIMRTFFTFIIGVLIGAVSVFLASNEGFTISNGQSSALNPIIDECIGQNLTLTNITAGETVMFPLTIEATVDNRSNTCNWTIFEAQAGSITMLDESNTVVANGVLTTTQNWMQVGPVDFTVTLTPTMTITSPETLTLLFEAENPSGDPALQQTKTFTVAY